MNATDPLTRNATSGATKAQVTIAASQVHNDYRRTFDAQEIAFNAAKDKVAEGLPGGWRAVTSRLADLARAQAKYAIAAATLNCLEFGPESTPMVERLARLRDTAQMEVDRTIEGSLTSRSTCPISNALENEERETQLHAWLSVIRTTRDYLARTIDEDQVAEALERAKEQEAAERRRPNL